MLSAYGWLLVPKKESRLNKTDQPFETALVRDYKNHLEQWKNNKKMT